MKLTYRPEIDGLRAIAVLPVILFHAGFTTFSGGFVGVDVFFVISGYLITSIIVKDVTAGTFSFWEFYERRARRILPALFLIMLCCIPFAWMWMMPHELEAFSSSVVSVCLFASNFLFWQQSGYFDTASELKPLLHTWSLAVEEQYYIIFPIAVLLLWRLGRRNVIWSIAPLAILSLAFSEYASRYYPSANEDIRPTREQFEAHYKTARAIFESPDFRRYATFIDVTGDFCDAEKCELSHDGRTLLYDKYHLSKYGSERLSQSLARIFGSTAGTTPADD